MRIAFILVLAGLVGCTPPPPMTAPAPLQLRVGSKPGAVVASAATTLTLVGFDVASSDGDGGNLTMKRFRGPHGNADYLVCRGAGGSYMDNTQQTTLTVVVVARPVGADSSDVIVRGSALSSYPQLIGSGNVVTVDSDCASNGSAEKAVRDAIVKPPR